MPCRRRCLIVMLAAIVVVAGETSVALGPVVRPVTHAELKEIIDEAGDVTVLNFWATWCIPCRREFPHFVRFGRDMEDRGVRVLFISMDFASSFPSVRRFLKKQGVPWVSYVTKGKMKDFVKSMGADWSGALPATFVYDGDGKLRDFTEGRLSHEDLQRRVLKILEAK